MTRWLLLWILLLAGAPASAQVTIGGAGQLNFGNISLTGFPILRPANSAPRFTINYEGPTNGFHVNLTMTQPLTSGTRTIDSSNLSFTASGGTITRLQGSNGPVETGNTGTLNGTLKVVTSPPPIQGRWRYNPLASNFVLDVPVEAYSGVYIGRITATLVGGP